MKPEEELYAILRHHKLPLKKREQLMPDLLELIESQLKEVKELLYKSKYNSQMSISEFEQFLYDRNKYLTKNKDEL